MVRFGINRLPRWLQTYLKLMPKLLKYYDFRTVSAPCGHIVTHAPHCTHLSRSICTLQSSLKDITPVGHTDIHAPQFTHSSSSLITGCSRAVIVAPRFSKAATTRSHSFGGTSITTSPPFGFTSALSIFSNAPVSSITSAIKGLGVISGVACNVIFISPTSWPPVY